MSSWRLSGQTLQECLYRTLDYLCKDNGRCVVDVTRRNQCQSCRFNKCLSVNMKKEAVQHERAPRTLIKRPSFMPRSSPYPSPFLPLLPNLQSYYSNFPPLIKSSLPTIFPSPPSLSLSGIRPSSFPSPPRLVMASSTSRRDELQLSEDDRGVDLTSKESEVSSSSGMDVKKQEDENVGEVVGEAVGEGKNVGESPVDCSVSPPSLVGESLHESAAKLLFMSVKWARSIPSFQQLTSSDQAVLLQHCWSHLLILSLSQWQVNISLSSDSSDTELRQAVNRISQLALDHTEFTCLKALVLFNPDTNGLSHSLQVEVLQDQTHLMLQEYCSAKHHQQHSGSKVRFGRLLLTLAGVFKIDKEELETMFFRGTLGSIRVDRLIMDLMQAKPIRSVSIN